MAELVLTPLFDFFKINYSISENSIRKVYNTPNRTLKISETRNLLYRRTTNESDKHMLLCTKLKQQEVHFAFAFWIPAEIASSENPLTDILEQFAQRFGSPVTINKLKAMYIGKTKITHSGNWTEIGKHISIQSKPSTPHFLHYIARQNNNEFVLSFVFAINNYRYWIWLHNIPVTQINIKAEWSIYLSNISQNLNPLNKTSLEVVTAKLNHNYEQPSNLKDDIDHVQLTIPVLYKPKFQQIVLSLQTYNNVQVIVNGLNKKCVFCGADSKSQEHILPKWFRSFFKEKQFDNMTHIVDSYDNLVENFRYGLSSGKESSYGITTFDVCAKCNGGWMSDLEKSVKSILARNSNELKETVEELYLNSVKSWTLARWLVCKAMLLASRSKILPNIHPEVLKNLKNDQLHSAFLVEILPVPTFGLNYQITIGKPFVNAGTDNENTLSKLAEEFFITTLHIGKFFLRISYWEHESDFPRVSINFKTFVLFSTNDLPRTKSGDDTYFDSLDDNSKLLIFSSSLGIRERLANVQD